MKFCIDDANVEKIRRIYEYYPIDGVSTNPRLPRKRQRVWSKRRIRSLKCWERLH